MTKDRKNITEYTIKVFPSSQLTHEPFLGELVDMINESYRSQDTNSLGKIGLRLEQEAHLVEGLGPEGITAIAFDNNNIIIGTASIKPWISDSIIWEPVGKHTSLQNDQVDTSDSALNGDYELSLVAIKPDKQFRKKGIAETLVSVCEKEVLANHKLNSSTSPDSFLRIMIKVVRQFNGLYWTRKGFKVVGEKYCPPNTWDLENEFILWAMKRELPLSAEN